MSMYTVQSFEQTIAYTFFKRPVYIVASTR